MPTRYQIYNAILEQLKEIEIEQEAWRSVNAMFEETKKSFIKEKEELKKTLAAKDEALTEKDKALEEQRKLIEELKKKLNK